ncbi:MAG: transposase, partial [Nanoarchaeota archaeon]
MDLEQKKKIIKKAERLKEQGYTYREIAENEFNVTYNTLYRWKKQVKQAREKQKQQSNNNDDNKSQKGLINQAINDVEKNKKNNKKDEKPKKKNNKNAVKDEKNNKKILYNINFNYILYGSISILVVAGSVILYKKLK